VLALVLWVVLACVPQRSSAQTVRETLLAFTADVPKADSLRLHHVFDATHRTRWDRIALRYEGLEVAKLPPTARIRFHNLLHASLSSTGYSLVLGIMNADIAGSTCFDASLEQVGGYWINVFGDPAHDPYWGYSVEGHHLSLNLTYAGDSLVAHTPFFFGAHPQMLSTGGGREGQSLIYQEEHLVGGLVDSLPPARRGRVYASGGLPSNLYGDDHLDTLYAPQGGIALWRLSDAERSQLDDVLDVYSDYFPTSSLSVVSFPEEDPAKLIYTGDTHSNGKHYYCIGGAQAQIECLNFGNHTHHLWRCDNDFGAAVIGR